MASNVSQPTTAMCTTYPTATSVYLTCRYSKRQTYMEIKAGFEPVLYVPVVLNNLVESNLECRNRIGSRRLGEVAFRLDENGI